MQEILNAPKISKKLSSQFIQSDDNFNLLNSALNSQQNSPDVNLVNIYNSSLLSDLNNFNLNYPHTEQDTALQNTIFNSILICNEYLNMKKVHFWRLQIKLKIKSNIVR